MAGERAVQRGGMWRLRPPEGRKHPGEPGSTSRWGGETARKSEGRLSHFPLPPARLTMKAPGQAAPLRRRPLPSPDPQGPVPPPPLPPAAAARLRFLFSEHTPYKERRGPASGSPGSTRLGTRRRAAHRQSPPGVRLQPSRLGPRSRPPCSSPPRRLPSPHRTTAPPDPPSSFWRQTVALVAAAAT